MQPRNWNDLRYLLAVARGQSMAAAARLLGVDDTTVARRLAALQESLGARLCQRSADGTLRLTGAGERAVLHAERMEREIGALDTALSGAAGAASGTVRLTAVPIVANRILVPAAKSLLQRHPALQLEIIGDAKDLNLTRRETDLALRLARPKTGGTKVVARRVGALRYAVYAASSCPARVARKLPWIGYDETMAHLPQARWIADKVASGERAAALRLCDAEAVLEAVVAGLGRSLLPCAVADCERRLQRLGPTDLTRELWLLTHAELRTLNRVEAVAAWIDEIAPR
jgi:DNA-binding transcriptional LysR family regulator